MLINSLWGHSLYVQLQLNSMYKKAFQSYVDIDRRVHEMDKQCCCGCQWWWFHNRLIGYYSDPVIEVITQSDLVLGIVCNFDGNPRCLANKWFIVLARDQIWTWSCIHVRLEPDRVVVSVSGLILCKWNLCLVHYRANLARFSTVG